MSASDLPVPGNGGEMLPLGESAIEMKQELATQRAEVTRAVAALQQQADAARAELKRRREEMELEFRRQEAELMETIKPLREKLAQVQELAHTVDLYLGRDEQIELLRDGESAPASEPVVLRQMVLAMDEESLVLLDDGGMDARSADVFLDWLVESDEHLDQVLPDQKGIVVLVPTRQRRNYGNSFEQMAMEEANKTSHWIIRNGQRVYRLIADIEVGDRLLPTRSEFLDFFYKRSWGDSDRIPMEPGSKEWLDAEKAASAKQRHYMKIMLVLQGLADRTVAFAPLPEGGLNFLSLDSQDQGKLRIINELDNVLTSGRLPFREWQRQLNDKLRPGMRIIADFGRQFDDANDYDTRINWGRHSRLHPSGASHPQSHEIYVIEDRAPKGGLVIRYERSDTVHRDSYYEESGRAKVRASCTLYPRDKFLLPYDLVSVEELRTYLHARTERHDYLAMVPVLRAALAAKLAEEEAEAPFRLLLLGALSTEHGVDVADIEPELPELVAHWKLANRWARPLVDPTPAEQAKAITGISREWAARRKAAVGSEAADRAALAAARTLPEVIAVGRRRDGQYTAFAPSAPYQNVWLDEYRITKRGKVADAKRWTIPSGRTLAALTMLHTTEEWDGWQLRASRSEHFAGPETAAFAERHLFANAPGPAAALVHKHDTSGEATGRFLLYCWATPDGPDVELGAASKIEDLLRVVTVRWKRSASGEMVAVPWEDRYGTHEFTVSDYVHFGWAGDRSHREMNAPGVEVEHLAAVRKRYGSDGERGVMIWTDPVVYEQLVAVHQRIQERSEQRRAEASRISSLGRRIVEAVMDSYVTSVEAERYRRFVEDFATEDPELWANHRKTLKDVVVQHDHDLNRAVGAVADQRSVVGMTLVEVAALGPMDRWQRTPRVPTELAELRIPELPTDADDEESDDDQ